MSNNIKILDRRFLPKGELVIEEGSIGERAFFIETGKVDIFMRDKKGRNVKIAEAGPGSIVGEMAILGEGERSASIVTSADSILVSISAGDIEKALRSSDHLMQQIMRLMATRLKDTNARLIRQNMELKEFEEAAELTVKNIGLHIPQNKQNAFKNEVVPLLDKLKDTLSKYHHI